MMAVVTTGTGGYDRLEPKLVPIPMPGPGEVLLRVLAAGINNTDINTRLGWYAGSVKDGTDATAVDADRRDGGWNGATAFPLIQGADCCGRVVAVGPGGDAGRIGERVLVRPCMRRAGFDLMDTVWLGTDFDGAFSQYIKVPESEAFAVACDWSDAELATIPCAYGTAENMVRRAGVARGDRVLVPGASGGVGSALVQLLARRGAEVIGVTSPSKHEAIAKLGAARVLSRDDDPLAILGDDSMDVVIDNVGGPGFAAMLKLLRRGGRYVTSGAIAGPVVALDLRDLYLKDITLVGCTAWDAPVFPDLVSYIETGEIRPLLAATYPLDRIAEAQRAFQEKQHIGKIVLLPPS
ncbi:alcohol dehydrogenase [Aquibium carbonis]|uniref:Alcohol dehydrogenase n=1 Tax=Aquibium carbonis TaxID=2495581 RepID=A0A3S0ASC8_9HYPH|nr:alcohol dehydrogenase family protein [Aquibium carbonis]RST85953.1 alcohol dehydrogenase [Aquibium carbonis]